MTNSTPKELSVSAEMNQEITKPNTPLFSDLDQTFSDEVTQIGGSVQEQIIQAEQRRQEEILNAGQNRAEILANGQCETIRMSENIKNAFDALRRGYPDKAMEEQCQGTEFRENANKIIDAIVLKTMSSIAGPTMRDLDVSKIVVVMPWRAGLAFAESYIKCGVTRFVHVSSRRNHETLKTEVDYDSGEVNNGDIVIIADPMLATGNTAVDAMHRVISRGATPSQLIVNAVVGAPIGAKMVNDAVGKNSSVKIIVGELDEKLDHRGYIVPGLGDFGDKYFHEFTQSKVDGLADLMKLDQVSHQKLTERFDIKN